MKSRVNQSALEIIKVANIGSGKIFGDIETFNGSPYLFSLKSVSNKSEIYLIPAAELR